MMFKLFKLIRVPIICNFSLQIPLLISECMSLIAVRRVCASKKELEMENRNIFYALYKFSKCISSRDIDIVHFSNPSFLFLLAKLILSNKRMVLCINSFLSDSFHYIFSIKRVQFCTKLFSEIL